ncbi:winged helix-turn-helix domain-containing protein [Plantactinospora sp. B5E13]|uniref:winged helix-turn-helix domain-containing protein n=1 Tax=unclassified Plantactinospora TaxID=2631981 RepID=UPI00325E85BF
MPEMPDYWRIADEIIADVRSGRLKPGDKLPSIAELRAQYDVSHGTVQMSYARLEALRVIRRHQGKGIFITDPATWMREP